MSKIPEGIPKTAYGALKSIVGEDYCADDPAITENYVKSGEGQDTLYQRGVMPPGVVVLPQNTAEVQKIVRVCYHYNLPYSVASSFWATHCGGKTPFHVTLDLARMRSMKWDEKHMVAIVEPGCIYSPLQAEAQERGLYTLTPGGGSQASVVANHLTYNYSPLSYRLGFPTRRILAVE